MALERLETDVVIVGAGTTGAYLAWRLADSGFSCLVLEKERLGVLGTDIGPFHMEESAFEEFDIPLPQGDELFHTISAMTTWSPSLRESLAFELPTLVMDKPRFIRRLHGYATDSGAEIVDETEVVGLVMERRDLLGVRAKRPKGELEARGRLIIDASGIDGSVRTLMTPGRTFETDAISNLDTIFVYMETWEGIEGELKPGVNSYPYFQGWCAPGPGETRIVGIGMTGSFDAARKRHGEFVRMLPFSGKKVGSAGGRIPYRRPPYSLVENGLLVAGDAAFMNKPFSGEGVTSALAACEIAVRVASDSIKRGDTRINALWPYNVGYFRSQGAKFAFMIAVLPSVMSLSAGEMDFLFTVPGVMTPEGALALQTDYEMKGDLASGLQAIRGVTAGLKSGAVSCHSIATMAGMALNATAIKMLYERYPETVPRHEHWVRRVTPLWRRADRARHLYFGRVGEALRVSIGG